MMDADAPTQPGSAVGSAPPTPLVDLCGKTLGEFRLLRRLGQGGMGQVYLAEQTSLKRLVAVKVMRPDVRFNMQAFQRFKAEAEAIARATHANIVQVYAFGEQHGLHYMALEYVEGRNLQQYLAKKGTTTVPIALAIMRQVAAALQRAGELGIIHRDIKPENILLTRRGEVKVADFGLARCFMGEQAVSLTQPGLTLGTPLYMSPEQIQGQAIDPRTDIYSFGVTCYHMLAGQTPFNGQTALELALHHVRTEPVPLGEVRPDLPAELCAFVHKMMAKDAAARYQTCAELLKDLARLKEAGAGAKEPGLAMSLPARAAGIISTSGAFKRKGLTAVIGTVAVALVCGGWWGWTRESAKPSATAAIEPSVPPLSAEEKHEQYLKEAVNQDADPGNDRGALNRGVMNRLELALRYLRDWRLDEADRLFAGLTASSVKSYNMLGRLGQAIVLAYRDKPEESNRLFLEVVGRRPAEPEPLRILLDKKPLRVEISKALEHNRANATVARPFPAELNWMREPPRIIFPRRPGGMPQDKGA